jgi:hypothetical protein
VGWFGFHDLRAFGAPIAEAEPLEFPTFTRTCARSYARMIKRPAVLAAVQPQLVARQGKFKVGRLHFDFRGLAFSMPEGEA